MRAGSADDSDDNEATWAFLDARIENVMQFEKFKARLKPVGEGVQNRRRRRRALSLRALKRALRTEISSMR